MRFCFSLLALLSASAAWADTIPVSSKVTEVTMYPDSAAITRTAEFQISAGKHRLVLQGVPNTATLETLRIDLTGARQIGTVFRDEYAPPREFNDPRIEEAEARIDEIEQRIQAVKDDATRAGLKGAAAEVSIGFLRQLGENEGLADATPDALRDIARMISAEAETAGQTALDAEIEARRIERQLQELEDELDTAEQALEALDVESENRVFIAVEVEADEASEGAIVLNYLSGWGTSWTPVYDLKLETGDSPKLSIGRGAFVQQNTGENWTDVTLHLSTLAPIGQVSPSLLGTHYRWIEDPEPVALDSRVSSYAEPLVEPPVIIEEAGSMWSAETDDTGVTYSYGEPVSITTGAETLRLELDVLNEPGEVMARAVPMQDEMAYRVVRFTNTSGEQLLSAEYAARYIDGTFIGIDKFDGLAAGEEDELGFGPIEGLQIRRDTLDQSEGGRGIISRSNQQVQKVEIEIENLTGETWPLHLRDRVPYSEQEDLQITWTATPRPSVEDLDKRRGILAWDLEIASGDSRKIELETSLSWPEGMELR
ncbi:DUF4139 domain-containing protein [Parasedimentitalea huanghaiensis]|uniref:Mucoidy inhibitor MuiA family protein n=1 Tax=Parasedimentitalea huanghaiensis TaxID=2682100 RepID=A0A6L6WFQ1_9RHOB|nr:DUF4139 domain-containing protein [Zongyanglinia huanghaiensis]MVO15435.1 mucoidy inhibitor MuiA family protein [Zongyanglinia huanghaiensis]